MYVTYVIYVSKNNDFWQDKQKTRVLRFVFNNVIKQSKLLL